MRMSRVGRRDGFMLVSGCCLVPFPPVFPSFFIIFCASLLFICQRLSSRSSDIPVTRPFRFFPLLVALSFRLI